MSARIGWSSSRARRDRVGELVLLRRTQRSTVAVAAGMVPRCGSRCGRLRPGDRAGEGRRPVRSSSTAGDLGVLRGVVFPAFGIRKFSTGSPRRSRSRPGPAATSSCAGCPCCAAPSSPRPRSDHGTTALRHRRHDAPPRRPRAARPGRADDPHSRVGDDVCRLPGARAAHAPAAAGRRGRRREPDDARRHGALLDPTPSRRSSSSRRSATPATAPSCRRRWRDAFEEQEARDKAQAEEFARAQAQGDRERRRSAPSRCSRRWR